MAFNLKEPNRKIHAGVILTQGITEMLDIASFEFFAWTHKSGVQLLNLPEEMWKDAIDFELHWVTEDRKPARLRSGTQVQPTDSFESCPPLDIAIMGAHDSDYKLTEAEIAFIRKVYGECSAFLTVCGGTASLLQSGLLSGKTATFPRLFIDVMRKTAPDVNWVEKRWANDGKLWTSGALLNGLDMMRAFTVATWGGRTGMIEALLDLGGYPVRDVDYKDFEGHHYPFDGNFTY